MQSATRRKIERSDRGFGKRQFRGNERHRSERALRRCLRMHRRETVLEIVVLLSLDPVSRTERLSRLRYVDRGRCPNHDPCGLRGRCLHRRPANQFSSAHLPRRRSGSGRGSRERAGERGPLAHPQAIRSSRLRDRGGVSPRSILQARIKLPQGGHQQGGADGGGGVARVLHGRAGGGGVRCEG